MYVLIKQQKYSEVFEIANKSEEVQINNKDRSTILTTLSYALIKVGQCQQSLLQSKRAFKLNPMNQKVKKHITFCENKRINNRQK